MSWTEAQVKAALIRTGQWQQARTPTLPALTTPPPEETAMHKLWQLAEAHGWTPDMHWFPKGPYAGLWCEFLRGTDVLRVLVHRPGKVLTRDQQRWLEALRETGKFDVFVCATDALEAVLTQLQSPEA